MLIVFDMDGTLTDLSRRLHYLQGPKKDWDAFYDACDWDQPKVEMCALYRLMDFYNDDIEIWTGRRESTRRKTRTWLREQKMAWRIPIRMRADNDRRKDHIIKREWIDQYGRPDLVFEDRKSVVDMYRSLGITCAQVAEGEF